MKSPRRNSRQRERIYELINSSKDHPTAQDVYSRLKNGMPSLSLGNVYRNIAILLEEGRLQSGEFGSGTVRYDAVTSGHYHFVCESCGAVSDFAMPVRDDLIAAARTFSSQRINGHSVRFYGVCAGCLGNENAKSKPRR